MSVWCNCIAESVAEKCDLCADREEGPACIKAYTKRAISVIDPAKIKIKNQEKYLAKLAGEYDVGSTSWPRFRTLCHQCCKSKISS